MSRAYLNLAREPYVNTRPVVRLSLLLWLVGAVFLAGNVWLYWDFLAGRGDTHARLAEVDREIASAEERVATLESELAGFDLAEQNVRVEYLNARIERRHFSWSRLFDALATLLPDEVRLSRLSPASPEDPGRGRRSAPAEDDRVILGIAGIARNDESILRMVDALFSDPAFDRPNLLRQTRDDRGLIRFDLETVYAPPTDDPPPDEPGPVGPVAMGAAASAPPEVAR